jgi:hypothetical protein
MHQWIAQVLHFTIEVTEAIILPFKNSTSSYQQYADTVASKNSAMAYLVKRGSVEELLVETAARDAMCTTYP